MEHFRKKLTIDLIIALAIILALASGLIFFGLNIRNLSSKIAQTRDDLKERSSAISSLAQLRGQYENKAKNYLNVLYNIVPAKDELIELSREFQTLANQERLGFGFSFLGENSKADNNLGSVLFRLNVQGENFNQLFRFIQRLQNFKYLSTLDGFSLNRRDSNLEMSIKGQVFFR